MDSLNQIFTWLSDHEAGFSALAALVVIIGVTLSPLGAGLRGLLSRKDKAESGITQSAKISEPDLSKTLNTPPSPITDKPSIAVLPFVNMSDDKDKEYFADGMTEDIITGLSCDSRLFVIARNSTFAYKGQTPDIRTVGKELGVRYVLEGSIRPVGERLRITLQLIETDTGTHIWADKIDRPTTEIFDIMDDVVDGLVTTLCSNLGVAEGKRTARQRPENLQAWELCVRAENLFISHPDSTSVLEAESLAQRAAAMEPDYAVSWALCALLASVRVTNGASGNIAQDAEQALSLVSKALRLTPNDPVVLSYCGFAATFAGQAPQAIDYLERSLAINPNNSFSRLYYGAALYNGARIEESITQLKLFIHRSPQDLYIGIAYLHLSFAYLSLNDPVQAEAMARNTVKHAPGFGWGYGLLAMSLGALGRDTEAQEQMAQFLRLEPGLTRKNMEDTWHIWFRKPEQAKHLIELLHQVWPDKHD
jgi:adenylate cyclase